MNADKIDSGEEALFFRLCAQPLPYNIYPSIMSIDFYFLFFFVSFYMQRQKREREDFLFIYFHIRLLFFFSVGGSDIKRERDVVCLYQERIGKRLWFRSVGRLQSIFFSLLFSLSTR